MNYLELMLTMQDFNFHKQFSKAKIVYEKYSSLIPKYDVYLQNKFLNEYEIACKKFVLKSKPRNLQIVLFNKCNSNCIMCNQHKEQYFLSEKYIEDISSNYLQYLDTLLWQGGELFLWDNFIDVVKQISSYKQINQQIITNAQCFDIDIIKKLCSIKNIKLIVSIDGIKKETYEKIRRGSSFTKLIDTLNLINKYRFKYKSNMLLNLNFVLLNENYKEIVKIVDFAKKYKFSAITFNECIPTKNYNTNFSECENVYIKEQLKLAIVNAVKNNIRVTVQHAKNIFKQQNNSNCMVCKIPFSKLLLENNNMFSPECTCLKKRVYGQEENLTIEKMWNSKLMQDYRKSILEIKNNSAICNSSCRLYKHYYFN